MEVRTTGSQAQVRVGGAVQSDTSVDVRTLGDRAAVSISADANQDAEAKPTVFIDGREAIAMRTFGSNASIVVEGSLLTLGRAVIETAGTNSSISSSLPGSLSDGGGGGGGGVVMATSGNNSELLIARGLSFGMDVDQCVVWSA